MRVAALALGLLVGCDGAPEPDPAGDPPATGKADDDTPSCEGWSEPLPLGSVGKVAFSEGMRMAAMIYAGRRIDDQPDDEG